MISNLIQISVLMLFLQTSWKNFYFAMLDLKTLPDRSQCKKVKYEQDKKQAI